MCFGGHGCSIIEPWLIQRPALPLLNKGDVGLRASNATPRVKFFVTNHCPSSEDVRALRSIGTNSRCMCPPRLFLCLASLVCLLRVVEVAQVGDESVDQNDDECPEDEQANEHERYGKYQPADEVEYTHACKVKVRGQLPPKKSPTMIETHPL